MLNVGYEVSLGGTTVASGPGSALLALEVSAGLRVPVNACRLTLHGLTGAAPAAGDPVAVKLGYDDALETVFTGTVTSVAHGLRTVEVEAMSAFAALASARLNLLYEQETAGGIAGDVLGKLAVTEGTVETGLKFASFALDDRRTVWAQLHDLARRCGFEFFADEKDQAQFRAYGPQATHPLAFGVDVLDFAHDARPAEVVGVEVHGASPAGQGQGDDASSWLTKKEVKGSAGETTGRVLRLVDPAARTQNLAGDVAKGVLAAYRRTAEGRVTVLGAPKVRLGDAVKLEKLPVAAQNGEARVTAVTHRLGTRTGFTTRIDWERS